MNCNVDLLVGLAVSIDGEPPVCIACAEKVANEGEYAHLFWMMNRCKPVDGAEICPECGDRMDSEKAQDAAVNVSDLVKPNASGEPRGLPRSAPPDCSACAHFEQAKPYRWGLCKHPLPWWVESNSPTVHPNENNAKDCECYTPNVKDQARL